MERTIDFASFWGGPPSFKQFAFVSQDASRPLVKQGPKARRSRMAPSGESPDQGWTVGKRSNIKLADNVSRRASNDVIAIGRSVMLCDLPIPIPVLGLDPDTMRLSSPEKQCIARCAGELKIVSPDFDHTVLMLGNVATHPASSIRKAAKLHL
jgi:hypothetical protein